MAKVGGKLTDRRMSWTTNKTLMRSLQEFRGFFRQRREYLSVLRLYQLRPTSGDHRISKRNPDQRRNDRMRLPPTRSIFERRDVLIVRPYHASLPGIAEAYTACSGSGAGPEDLRGRFSKLVEISCA